MNNKRNKTGGREIGTPNKITKDIREAYQLLIENNLETLESDLNELTAKERIDVLIKLSEFIVPKLQRSQIEQKNIFEDLKLKGIIISD
jgi:hypothetical protein